MPAVQSQHPSSQLLRAFAVGELAPEVSAGVAQHVAACAQCCEALRLVPDDTLLRCLRNVPSPAVTEALGETTAPSAATIAVPIPLRDHPRYRILARLGEGGMGTVFKAEHRLMKRIVALKVISPELLSNPRAVQRFRQEVEAAAKLSHPHIVAAHDAEEANGLHFLVMEYVEGITLAGLVEKNGPLSIPYACHFMRQAALGLQHAHDKGMVHRDIKPQNMMVTSRAQLKILDFGLARLGLLPNASDTVVRKPALTAPDVVIGTPDYLSPEQALSSRDIDSRADLYSLGCTFYYLLTGRVPFPTGSWLEKLLAHSEDEPQPIEKSRAEVPAGVIEVVRRLMAKKPEDRYARAAEVASALAPFTKAPAAMPAPAALPLAPVVEAAAPTPVASVAPTVEIRTPKKRPAPKTQDKPKPRRKPVIAPRTIALVCVGLLLLVSLAVILATRNDPDGPKTGGGHVGKKAMPRDGKKQVLYVLASQDFFIGDYKPVRDFLVKQGIGVKVASTSMAPAQPQRLNTPPEVWDHTVEPDLLLSEARVEDFDLVIFCGGIGVKEYMKGGKGADAAKDFITEMLKQGKPVTAVCLGPAILADAGALAGRKATCWPWREQVDGVGALEDGKASYQKDKEIVVDGLIITARDPGSIQSFAKTILAVLTKRP